MHRLFSFFAESTAFQSGMDPLEWSISGLKQGSTDSEKRILVQVLSFGFFEIAQFEKGLLAEIFGLVCGSMAANIAVQRLVVGIEHAQHRLYVG